MNFTQVNYLMDEVMPDVKPATFKIISIVARQTWGWKGRSSAVLSYTDLRKLTGIGSINTIKAAICEALKYIEQVEKEGQGFEYSMKPIGQSVSIIDTVEAESVSEIDIAKTDTVSEIDTVLCQKLTESVSEIDIATSGSKEKKEIKNNNDDDGLSFADAVAAYENNIAIITPAVSDELGEMVDEVGAGWVIDAVKIAAKQNKRNWAYAAAILRNWKALGHQDSRNKTNGTNGHAAQSGTTNQDGSFY